MRVIKFSILLFAVLLYAGVAANNISPTPNNIGSNFTGQVWYAPNVGNPNPKPVPAPRPDPPPERK